MVGRKIKMEYPVIPNGLIVVSLLSRMVVPDRKVVGDLE
jgi:hypothetical protein